jgi:hypothetical protein
MEQPSTIPYPEGDLATPARPACNCDAGTLARVAEPGRAGRQRAGAVRRVQVSRNGRGGKREAAHGRYSDEADARYAAALKLVQTIDHNLQKGTRHYYDTQGRLLNTLDEVIHAMLADSLVLGGPDGYLQSDESMEWASVGELAA